MSTTTPTNSPAWSPASLINTPSPLKKRKMEDEGFCVGQTVEVYDGCGWRKGEVLEVVDDPRRYKVMLLGGGGCMVVDDWEVRGVIDWKQDDVQQINTPKLVLKSKEGTKLRIKCTPRAVKAAAFQTGTRVEVRSNEEGYHGSWFAATVVGSEEKDDKLLVQYETLKTEDETQALTEMADVSNIRPRPPIINRLERFKMFEKVNAWYNDGWWVGLVSKVLNGLKYVVYFWTTNEEIEFQHSMLRPHQDMINGKWVASFLRPKLSDEPRLEKVELRTGEGSLMVGPLRGLRVEIAHGKEGYLSTWYPAVIIRPAHNGKYLVEYRTLKTNDGCDLLIEQVDTVCLRPAPPVIQRVRQFQQNDGVDAWDVNGWRIGQICTTMKESKYAVYFVATDTVTEFHHADLRPHQDFINGAWVPAVTDMR
ncbi:agenet domain-containing protein [Artemisia annua]|uniref:Agenet domain-containing protein n=1 Tax=Artemisia annua TaxID=35608 RepID=A0A2U1NW19_ARTAN|nr:agenet domain-containing protein [Artemisia annua]